MDWSRHCFSIIKEQYFEPRFISFVHMATVFHNDLKTWVNLSTRRPKFCISLSPVVFLAMFRTEIQFRWIEGKHGEGQSKLQVRHRMLFLLYSPGIRVLCCSALLSFSFFFVSTTWHTSTDEILEATVREIHLPGNQTRVQSFQECLRNHIAI